MAPPPRPTSKPTSTHRERAPLPRITYQPKKFTPAHQLIISIANDICAEYAEQGFD